MMFYLFNRYQIPSETLHDDWVRSRFEMEPMNNIIKVQNAQMNIQSKQSFMIDTDYSSYCHSINRFINKSWWNDF